MTFKICKEGSWDVQFLERSPAIPSNMKFPIAVRNPMRTWGNTSFQHGSAQGPLDQLLQLGAKVSVLLLHVCGFCPHPMDAGPSFSPVPVVTSKPCWLLFSASRHWKGKNAKEKKMQLNYSTRTLAMTMKSLGGNQSTSNPLHPNSSGLNKFSFDKDLHAPTFKMVWHMVMAPPSIRLYLVASYTSIPRKAVFPHWACLGPNSGTRCAC